MDRVAAKRRVLVDALTMCLERSKVCTVIDAATLRSVLATASGEMWREGEFRLEYVWKILCQQEGLTAKEVAPPLLVFKAFETELGVNVRVPQALSALPRGEQVRLRSELGIGKADFAKTLAELHELAAADQKAKSSQELKQIAAQRAGAERAGEAAPAPTSYGGAPRPKKDRTALAIGLSLVAAVAVAVGLFVALHDPAAAVDLSDTAALLHLSSGVRNGPSLTAQISDPKWDGLSKDEQRQLATQIFDLLATKGVSVLTLTDGKRIRVQGLNARGTKTVNVH